MDFDIEGFGPHLRGYRRTQMDHAKQPRSVRLNGSMPSPNLSREAPVGKATANHTVNKGLRGIKATISSSLCSDVIIAINFHHLLTPYLLQLVGSLALNSSIPMISMCPLYDLYPCSSTYLYPSVCKQETTKAASSSQRSWQRSTVEPDCSQTH